MARRLVTYVAISSIVLTLLSAGYLVYQERQSGLLQIGKTLALLKKSYLPGLNHAVWVYNYEQAAVLLEGALGLPDVEYLAVTVNEEIIASAGRSESQEKVVREFPLIRHYNDADMQFGVLKVVISLDTIYQRIRSRTLLLLASNASIIFLSAACLLVFFYLVVGRHLQSLAHLLSRLNIDDSDEPLQALIEQKKVPDEIDNVLAAVIEMRKRTRLSIERLSDSEEHLHLVFENAPVCLFQEDFSELKIEIDRLREKGVQDFDAYFKEHPRALLECADKIKITNVNQMALDLHRAESKDDLFAGLAQIFTRDSFDIFRKEITVLAAGKNRFRSESTIKTLDGREKEVFLELIVDPSKADWSRTYVAITDLTELKDAERKRLELETQLRQKFKMETVGLMAGGMAHNFNNNLAIILGNLEISRGKLSADSKIINYLDSAKLAVLRSRDLVMQILSYSRKGAHDKIPIRLAPLVEETYRLLFSTIPNTVRLRRIISIESVNATLKADASRIQEILINLCNNAVHAMDEKGDLTIRLELSIVRAEDIPAQYRCLPGRYAGLSVSDTGCGMSAETLERIFDPFFTTKEAHQGTGLGLSTVQGIVDQHGGFIKVASTLGQGSTFSLFFPLVEVPVEKVAPPVRQLPKGDERILFVDDEEMLAGLGEEQLTAAGYQVTAVTDSLEALRLFKAQPEAFDLVITDQTMPELCGKDFIRELLKIRPDLPTILLTGYSSKVTEDEVKQLGIKAFCLKPMDLSEMVKIVRRVLDKVKDPGC
ncbi:MAG: response regulator [Deltaproteobacteria bacterium]|nr:response regulator [Deltaproteobacteria bacterium]